MVQGTLFRSEEMTYFKLYIPTEIAQQTVATIGELQLMEFRDLNPDVNAFQRSFVNEIRRLDEMERKLRFLTSQMEKMDIHIGPAPAGISYARTRTQNDIDRMESELTEHEARIIQMNQSYETLQKRFLELEELRFVLRETQGFFEASKNNRLDEELYREESSLLGGPAPVHADDSFEAERGEGPSVISLGFVAGVILRGRMGIFERILFRALRGNLYMNYSEIPEPIMDPTSDEMVQKNAFIIFAHGKELLAKIRKICESLGATLYPVDERAEKRRVDALEVISRIEDLRQVLDNTRNAQRVELSKVAATGAVWNNLIIREKAIYYTMNFFSLDSFKKSLIAEGWCPTNAIPAITYSLSGVTERTGSTVAPIFNEQHTTRTPPTFHRTNKFTRAFQEIVDAYGCATYREVNPGLFTTITFPFLFAVMFGDFGHGIIMALFALWMVLFEKRLEKKNWGENWDMFFNGRYIILLMGFFSIYTGLIYNDVFSKAFNFYGSGWVFERKDNSTNSKYIGKFQYAYPFGVDPAWHNSDNNLLFSNSYKMKMAIIFGIMQMTFGICLNVFNYIHFNKKRSIITQFVPQITFLLSIFGYLTILIIYKWCADWSKVSPPGLLNTLIYMFLKPGTVEEPLYSGQAGVQVFLLLLAFVCVPWMLLAEPYFEYKEHHNARALGYANVADRASMDSNPPANESGHEEMHKEEHFDFGEIMVHQTIHTIEFCLNAISNTASYLRLWALSLAHAQLSEVLWEMVLEKVFEVAPTWYAIAFAFYFWFGATVGILIVMEGLSAFLHALRLHWVEFQGKFYGAQGSKFQPFSFEKLGEATE